MKAAIAVACAAALASAGPLRAQAADTAVVHVRGPVVVACFERVEQARVDADEEMATGMDDFAWHWSEAARSLEARGVAAESRGSGWVKLATRDDRLRLVRCPKPVGYVLAAPGRLPKVLAGVTADLDLLRAAAAYFRRPELARKEDGDARHR